MTATLFVSPSMRRAWIEIFEDVIAAGYTESPSMRRAWIEISTGIISTESFFCRPLCGGRGLKSREDCIAGIQQGVALYAEGVD